MASPRVSIIINNYNYGRFLGKAIESALAQSYPYTEVIVVDDGSTDFSRAVIASYGDRIHPILQKNGGQAAALNAGFAHCQGKIVIFLDADDMLHPDVVERIVAAFTGNPDVVRVQYRLEIVDATGAPTGQSKPARRIAIPHGDLRQSLLRYGDDIPWLPTSGNAFAAEMLRRIFPIPEAPYRLCADYYLSNLSPLFGRVVALPASGGFYRVHNANHHERVRLNLEQTRQLIVRTHQTHGYLRHFAHEVGLITADTEDKDRGKDKSEIASRSLIFLANRLISLRLGPDLHPLVDDRPLALAQHGIIAAWRRTDLPWLLRLAYAVWFPLAALMPRRATQWLAELLFYPEARGAWLNDVRASLHRQRMAQ